MGSNNVVERVPKNIKPGQGEGVFPELGNDRIDILLSSFGDSHGHSNHIAGNSPGNQCPEEAAILKTSFASHMADASVVKKNVKQRTSTPGVKLIPTIKKGGRKYQCTYCLATLQSTENCVRHVNVVHKKPGNCESPICCLKC